MFAASFILSVPFKKWMRDYIVTHFLVTFDVRKLRGRLTAFADPTWWEQTDEREKILSEISLIDTKLRNADHPLCSTAEQPRYYIRR